MNGTRTRLKTLDQQDNVGWLFIMDTGVIGLPDRGHWIVNEEAQADFRTIF